MTKPIKGRSWTITALLGGALCVTQPMLPPVTAQDQADVDKVKVFTNKLNEGYAVPYPNYLPDPTGKSNSGDADWQRRELLARRFETANRSFKMNIEAFGAGTTVGTLEGLVESLRRFTESEVARCPLVVDPKPEDYVNAYERAVKFAEAIEYVVELRHKAGKVPPYEPELIRYHRLSMQIKLLEAKKELKAKTK